jgi:hypothetical protein
MRVGGVMLVARLIILSFLILGILFTYSPFVKEEVSQFWEHVRPGVIVLMDDLYATVRNFIAGSDSRDGIEDNAPGVDFDRIITMVRGSSS